MNFFKLSTVAPLARVGTNAPAPHGDSNPATLIANPFGTQNTKSPDAHEYENGHLFAEHLGFQAISQAEDQHWLSWQQHSDAWKQGFADTLRSLGLARDIPKLAIATKVSAMSYINLFDRFTAPATDDALDAILDREDGEEKLGFLPMPVLATGGAMGLHSMGSDEVTHDPNVSSKEQDAVRANTSSGLGDAGATILDDAALGGVLGAGVGAVDRYGIAPRAWNAVNDAAMTGVTAVGKGLAPTAPPAAPDPKMDMAQRMQGARDSTYDTASKALQGNRGFRFESDPAAHPGFFSRTARGGLAGLGLGLAAGIPHSIANAYMGGHDEAAQALHDYRTKESSFAPDDLEDEEAPWASSFFGEEKMAAFSLNPVRGGSDDVIARNPQLSGREADDARPGFASNLAGNLEAAGGGLIGAGFGGLAGAIGAPLLGGAVSMIPGGEGVGETISNMEIPSAIAGAGLGAVTGHQIVGRDYGRRHTVQNLHSAGLFDRGA